MAGHVSSMIGSYFRQQLHSTTYSFMSFTWYALQSFSLQRYLDKRILSFQESRESAPKLLSLNVCTPHMQNPLLWRPARTTVLRRRQLAFSKRQVSWSIRRVALVRMQYASTVTHKSWSIFYGTDHRWSCPGSCFQEEMWSVDNLCQDGIIYADLLS